LETCAILTVEANATLAPFHDRMPVILDPPCWASWLDPAFRQEGESAAFLKPYPDGLLEALAVNPKINNPAFQAPEGLASLGLPI
jgi:putative SOS response-associated peptidase YedK